MVRKCTRLVMHISILLRLLIIYKLQVHNLHFTETNKEMKCITFGRKILNRN